MEENKTVNKNEAMGELTEYINAITALCNLYQGRQLSNEMKNQRTTMVQQIEIILHAKSDEMANEMMDEITKMTYEEAKAMTYEDLKEFVGKYTEDVLDIYDNETDLRHWIADVIETRLMLDEIDKEMAEMADTLNNLADEVQANILEKGDMIDIIRKIAQIVYDDPKSSIEQKIAAKKQMNAVDDALTLEPVIKLYESIGVKNTKSDFGKRDRRDDVISKYKNTLKQLKLKVSLVPFINKDLETFMEPENVPEKNIILFAIMKYAAGQKTFGGMFDLGMFLTSLNVLLCEIFMDLAKPEVKEKFVEGLNTLGKMFK